MNIYHSSYKFLRYCSCLICKEEIAIQNIKQHIRSKHTIKTNCKQCSKPLYQNRKFCDRSCATTYNNNQRNYYKFKPGPPKGYKWPPYTKVAQCVICKKFFPGRKKTCSDACKRMYISKQLKRAFKEGRHKGNLYRNRSNTSYLEQSFIDYLKDQYLELSYEYNKPVPIKSESGQYLKCFYIDFYLPYQNIGIELDGSQHEYTMEYDSQRDLLINQKYQTKIIRVKYKEYFNKSRKEEIDQLLNNEMILQKIGEGRES